VPPTQDHYERAAKKGFQAVAAQSDGQLVWLGAERSGGRWRLPVLEDVLEIDLPASQITTAAGEAVGEAWRILVLHYLAVADRPARCDPGITFADLRESRTYDSVYQGRVIGRLCATAGRSEEKLRTAAAQLAGRAAQGGDLAFDFDLFPRLTVRLIWHAPDDEFPPSATLLLPTNIEAYLPAEDIVVYSECLVARLGGRPF
jgi:hypothetical protein